MCIVSHKSCQMVIEYSVWTWTTFATCFGFVGSTVIGKFQVIVSTWQCAGPFHSWPSVEVSSSKGCREIGSDPDAEMTNSKRSIQHRVQLSSSKLGVPCNGIGSVKFVCKKKNSHSFTKKVVELIKTIIYLYHFFSNSLSQMKSEKLTSS